MPGSQELFQIKIVDGSHWELAIRTLRSEKDPQWTRDIVRVWHQYRRDGCVIMIVEAINLARVKNLKSVVVRRHTLSINPLKSMKSYTHVFEMDYSVRFFDARFSCIVDDMISSQLLLSNSRPTYVRYIHVRRLALRHDTFLIHNKDLRVKGATSKSLGFTYIDDATEYHSRKEDAMLIICAGSCCVLNVFNLAPFHSLSFYKRAHLILKVL